MPLDITKDQKRRVVVTGLGVISSIGIGVEDFWKNLIAGTSGISEIESFDTSAYLIHKGGEVKNFKPEDFIDRRKIKFLGRASQMAIAAAKLAVEDAKLPEINFHELGVLLGTTMGEIRELEKIDIGLSGKSWDAIQQSLVSLFPANVITANVAAEFKAQGHNYMLPTACSAGNYCIGYAFDLIKSGELEVALAGGSDALSRIAFTGFNRLMAMAPDKCQPFDKNRKGIILGEGAGILLLESLEHAQERGAKIYAEVLGYGLSCDAYHMTHPLEEGVIKCMEKALKESNISKDEVDYISAHGTGTEQNDKTECSVIKKVFINRKKQILCSSIKSMLGHSLGAASAIEAIACCLTIERSIIPPTINYETFDEECDIDCVPNKARKHEARTVLNNSYAFGGNNACVIIRIYS